jgi:protease-4
VSWCDSLLWSIRPDCRADAAAILAEVAAADGRGLHRDNLDDSVHEMFARWLELDRLPIDMHTPQIAIVSVVGPLVNRITPISASYPLLTEAFERLQADTNVRAVVVRFKSPGGTVSGLEECAKALDRLSDAKLTIAQNDGGCYSAAYFLACHCGEIYSSETDHIGNIGTVSSLDDYSELYKSIGVRTVTSRTGPIKGLGIMGDPITDPQQAFLQHMVDAHFDDFKAAVVNGRSMTEEQFAAVSDGRWWLGREAQPLGIIDRVSTLSETLKAIESFV